METPDGQRPAIWVLVFKFASPLGFMIGTLYLKGTFHILWGGFV